MACLIITLFPPIGRRSSSLLPNDGLPIVFWHRHAANNARVFDRMTTLEEGQLAESDHQKAWTFPRRPHSSISQHHCR
jgi:hypothetical protein